MTELTTQIHPTIKLQIKTGNPLKKADFIHTTYVETENDYFTFITTNISDGLIELLPFLKSLSNPILDIRVLHQSLEESFLGIAKGANNGGIFIRYMASVEA